MMMKSLAARPSLNVPRNNICSAASVRKAVSVFSFPTFFHIFTSIAEPSKKGKRRGESALTVNEPQFGTIHSFTVRDCFNLTTCPTEQSSSEEPSNGKGKERADYGQFAGYQNLTNDEPGTLVAELQNTRCMAAKYKSDVVSRCLSCTRRWAGDTCRFLGVRWLMRRNGVIEGVSFVKAPHPGAGREVTFPTEWNIPFTREHRQITMVCNRQVGLFCHVLNIVS